MTTGDPLDDAAQTAFETWLAAGGNWVGIHSAADTEYTWPVYGTLVGAYFKQHPPIQQATVRIEVAEPPGDRGPARRHGCAPTSGTTSRPTRAPPPA